jgi:nucleoprotein TPR
MSAQQNLINVLERRADDARVRVEEMEAELERVLTRQAEKEDSLRDDVKRAERARNEAEKRVEEMKDVVDRLAMAGAPVGMVGGQEEGEGSAAYGISPTAALASRMQKAGRTYTEVYTDYVRLQNDLVKEKAETSRLEGVLTTILADIDERVSTRRNVWMPVDIVLGTDP